MAPRHIPSSQQSHRPEKKVRRAVLLAGSLLTIALLALLLSRPTALVQLDAMGYDLLLRTRQHAPPPAPVVIVDIDEKSLQELGQWPWPRYQMARLLDMIRGSGAQATAIDSVFAEPDRLSLSSLGKRFRQDLHVTIGIDGIPAEYLDNDAILSRSMGHADIVAGLWFDFDTARPAVVPDLAFPQVLFKRAPDAPEAIPLPHAAGVLAPTPALAARIQTAGFLNALPDRDGTIRRAPLLINYQGRTYPSLALAAVMRAAGVKQVVAMVSAAGVEEVVIDSIRIPTDRHGNMLLPFSRAVQQRFPRISAVDILRGAVPAERLRGAIVFVGSTATAQNDVHPTPLDRQLPGILVHAVTADTMLRRDFLHSPSWASGAGVVLATCSCALMTLLLARYSLQICAAAGAGGAAVLAFGSGWLFMRHGLFLSPVFPLLSLAGSFGILGVIRFRGEEKAAIQKTRELSIAQDCTIFSLVSITETRDVTTGNHIIRTQRYVRVLAEQLARRPEFRKILTADVIETISKSAPLHDVGKVGVPDRILLKPGRLTEEEYLIMRQHTTIGQQALERAERISGLDAEHSFLRCAEDVAAYHHERWDGTGYMKGLKGEEIPLAARLMALADVYDAIRSKRPYKEIISHEAALQDIAAGSGTQFDPVIVEVFMEVEQTIREIAQQYPDEDHVWGHVGLT